jgi:hypothetical protein
MTYREKKLSSDEYKVGYGKPPVHIRFRKGTRATRAVGRVA